MTLSELLGKVTAILDATSVPYMLTGSLAAACYAAPRSTQDIDLVIEVTSGQVDALTGLLAKAGLYVSQASAREALRYEGQFNAIDPGTGWKIDFIIRKGRPFSLSEFGRRSVSRMLGLALHLTTPEDLVIAKLERAKKGGSELQLRDVRAILRATGPDFDQAYVERWVHQLGLLEMREAAAPPPDPVADVSESG